MPSSSACSAELGELVAFCKAHPGPDTDPERFLRHLCSGPAAIIDRRVDGLVAVIIDQVRSASGSPPFELVGLKGDSIAPDAARRLVEQSLRQARDLKLQGMEFLVRPLWAPHRAMLEENGFVFSYGDLDMDCANPDWGADMPIPDGWRWSDVSGDWLDEYFRIQREAFANVAGYFMPPEEEMRRTLRRDGIAGRILNDGKRGYAILRLTLPTGIINAVARDPAARGKGFGRLALDEARRQMPGRALGLNVVSTNKTAIELYRRHGFKIIEDLPALLHRFE